MCKIRFRKCVFNQYATVCSSRDGLIKLWQFRYIPEIYGAVYSNCDLSLKAVRIEQILSILQQYATVFHDPQHKVEGTL